jgi:8-oxo-dGTP diphosphatase
MARESDNRTIRAAGGVLWRTAETAGDGVEVGVIHRPRYDDWSIPKGKLAPGEDEISGALREVLEETGQRVHLGRSLGEVRYDKKTEQGVRPKVVRYWAMQTIGGVFSPNNEVDELRWVLPATAMDLLSYERDRGLLERFLRGPSALGTVLLVRHASAGSSDEWDGDDNLRPLDPVGEAQADELVRRLSRFDVAGLYSAGVLRCSQTLEPLAQALGTKIVRETRLDEKDYFGNEEATVSFIRGIARPSSAVIACSQGGLIPDLVARLGGRDQVDLPSKIRSKKGSTWVLSFDDGRLFSADYLSAPVLESI